MHAARKNLARVLFVALALFSTGLTWAVADVESRSAVGAWGSEGPAYSNSGSGSQDLIKQIEYLQQEMQELRGKVEEQAYVIQQLQETQKKIYGDLDSRIGNSSVGPKSPHSGVTLDMDDASGALDLDNTSPPTQSYQSAAPAAHLSAAPMPSPEAIVAEERAYQQAYRLVQRKDLDGAVAAFQALNKQYPKGKYLPNANYWLGEIYLTKNKLDLAAQAFESVYRGYPQHPKAADALLKMGYVAYAQGQFKRAESIFQKVKSEFTNSTSSQSAESKLSQMQHEGRA